MHVHITMTTCCKSKAGNTAITTVTHVEQAKQNDVCQKGKQSANAQSKIYI